MELSSVPFAYFYSWQSIMSKSVCKICINYIIPLFTGLYKILQLTEKCKSPLLSGGVSSNAERTTSVMVIIQAEL